jgi:HK97 family phage portal protein
MNIFRHFTRAKEKRAGECPSWTNLQGNTYPMPFISNPNFYECLSALAGCVNIISSSLASCPAMVYRTEGNVRIEAPDYPLSELIHNGANQYQSWHDFIEMTMRQVLLRGNAFAHIIFDGAGQVRELRPYPWEWVQVEVKPNGKIIYTVTDAQGMYGRAGVTFRLLPEEALHIKDGQDLPFIGVSRIRRSAAVFRGGLDVQEFASSLYGQGVRPSGALEVPVKLEDDARAKLSGDLAQFFTGAKNTAKAMVLENGMKWNSFAISAEDAEALASRQFTVEEIARLYSVPPPLIGDLRHGTFQNSETAGRWFAMFCLSPWTDKLEAEFRRTVFSETDRSEYDLVIDLSGLTRGDHAARWNGHVAAVQNGILSANEVREIEGWNPHKEGDALRVKGVGNADGNS